MFQGWWLTFQRQAKVNLVMLSYMTTGGPLNTAPEQMTYLSSSSMLVCESGFEATFIPWREHQAPKILDYAFRSTAWRDVPAKPHLALQKHWVATTGHTALCLTLSPRKPRVLARDPGDRHRATKCVRLRRQKRPKRICRDGGQWRRHVSF